MARYYMAERRSEEEPSYSITRAEDPHSKGVDARMKRYAFHMALRIVCLIVAVCFDGWIRWVAVVGVAVLPWMAVVLANGSDRAERRNAAYYVNPASRELGPGTPVPPEADEAGSGSAGAGSTAPGPEGSGSAPASGEDEGPVVIDGEFYPGHRPEDQTAAEQQTQTGSSASPRPARGKDRARGKDKDRWT